MQNVLARLLFCFMLCMNVINLVFVYKFSINLKSICYKFYLYIIIFYYNLARPGDWGLLVKGAWTPQIAARN